MNTIIIDTTTHWWLVPANGLPKSNGGALRVPPDVRKSDIVAALAEVRTLLASAGKPAHGVTLTVSASGAPILIPAAAIDEKLRDGLLELHDLVPSHAAFVKTQLL